MAGSPEQRTGYKVAQFIEDKSIIVGGIALAVSFIVPAFLGLAALEGAQIVGAEVYKGNKRAANDNNNLKNAA